MVSNVVDVQHYISSQQSRRIVCGDSSQYLYFEANMIGISLLLLAPTKSGMG